MILGFVVFFSFSTLVIVQLAGRARGKMVWQRKGRRDPAGIWTSLLLMNFLFMMQPKSAFHHFFWAVTAASFLLGWIGWTLEKKRGE